MGVRDFFLEISKAFDKVFHEGPFSNFGGMEF